MEKVLITGGAGFIGSHLSEYFLQKGYEVYIIDDLSTGSIRNIEHLKSNPKFSYTLDNVLNKSIMLELIDKVDYIIHLAAAVGVKLIVQRPVYTIENNIEATKVVLELASKKMKPVLIASTSEVYGKLDKELFNERDNLVLGSTYNFRWCYAASKIIDEFLAIAYYREKRLPTIVVRFFNTIGPRQTGQYGMVVPRFVRQALRGEPITVYGNGTQRRSFTWVGDVVWAIGKLIHEPKAYGDVINIGHVEDISIIDLAKQIKELTKSKSKIVFVPYEKAYEPGFEDMPRRKPDISKINKLIGYKPTKSLREMLIEIIEYEKRNSEE